MIGSHLNTNSLSYIFIMKIGLSYINVQHKKYQPQKLDHSTLKLKNLEPLLLDKSKGDIIPNDGIYAIPVKHDTQKKSGPRTNMVLIIVV